MGIVRPTTLDADEIGVNQLFCTDLARRLVEGYVEPYNNVRLNSATGYITPKDVLAGRQQEIRAERDRKLEAARQQRQVRRQQGCVKSEAAATPMSDSQGKLF